MDALWLTLFVKDVREMQIIKIAKGKEIVIAEGTRAELNNRLKQLRKSTRAGVSGRYGKYSVRYELREQN